MSKLLLTIAGALLLLVCNASAQAPSSEAMDAARKLVATLKIADQYRAALPQLLLKLTAPCVPDLYQGTEDWDFSLVDPDNRRPIDFARRQNRLPSPAVKDTLGRWRDGAVKTAIVALALALRRALPELFANGNYEPVIAEGPMADHVVAFVRRHAGNAVLTVVPRLPTSLLAAPDRLDLNPEAWQDTTLHLDESRRLMSVLDPGMTPLIGQKAAVAELLQRIPVALFSTKLP